MCGRYSVNRKNVTKEHRYAKKLAGVPFEKNFDARPSQSLPVILPNEERALMAVWSSPEKEPDGKPTLPFNVRRENLLFIPRFRALLPRNRCIIPVDGFFEWKEVEHSLESPAGETDEGLGLDLFGNPIRSEARKRRLSKEKPKKQKYRFTLKDDEPFGLAGLWRESIDRDSGELLHYFSIITTAANKAVAPYHDRMPVILTPRSEETWMDNRLIERQWLDVLQPYDHREMVVRAIEEYESTLGNYVEPRLISR